MEWVAGRGSASISQLPSWSSVSELVASSCRSKGRFSQKYDVSPTLYRACPERTKVFQTILERSTVHYLLLKASKWSSVSELVRWTGAKARRPSFWIVFALRSRDRKPRFTCRISAKRIQAEPNSSFRLRSRRVTVPLMTSNELLSQIARQQGVHNLQHSKVGTKIL